MKLFNQNTIRVGDFKTIEGTNGETLYPNKLTEAQLNALGYYLIENQSQPNRRYYTYTEQNGVVNGKYVKGYTAIERPIDEVKQAMLKDLKDTFVKLSERPKVDTGLGYTIDGGRADLNNFEIGREFGFPIIKDADGIDHPATDADYATAILAIKQKGISLYEQKWGKEAEILALPTVADCISYENTPYDYTVTQADVDADIDGTLTVGQVITRYKNNVKDW